jgi:hypothetical protein
MIHAKRNILVWTLAAGLTLLSLVVHLASPSSMHQTEQNWDERVTLHQTEPAFTVRPITTAIVVFGHDTFGLSHRTAFFSLQFILMLLVVAVFYYYLHALAFNHREALTGMLIFGLSLPVFLAHFDPMYTWSDFWVYLCIPLSFLLTVKRWWFPAVMSFVVAVIARETSAIFLLPWVFLIADVRKKEWYRVLWLPVAAVIIIAVIRFFLFTTGAFSGNLEYKLAFNFESFIRSRDTLYSLLVSLGFLWPVGIYELVRVRSSSYRHSNFLRFGASLTAITFVTLTLLFAQARETRLFFPPVIFFIPLVLIFVRSIHSYLAAIMYRLGKVRISVLLLILFIAAQACALLVFPDFDFRTWKDGHRIWFGLHLCATIIFVLVLVARRAIHNRDDSPSFPW